MTDAQGREIVMVVDSEAALREDYGSIRELAASTSVVAIVRGVVSATRDVYSDRLAFRILTVDVTQVMRGQVGRQISVLEDGGVVPYAAVKDDLGTRDNAPSAPARTDGYVDFRFMGARHSEAGDDVVLVLGVNPNRDRHRQRLLHRQQRSWALHLRPDDARLRARRQRSERRAPRLRDVGGSGDHYH